MHASDLVGAVLTSAERGRPRLNTSMLVGKGKLLSLPSKECIPMGKFEPERLLQPRRQSCVMLGGISLSSVIRLERAKLLTPIKLRPGGQVFHESEEVRGLVR